MSPQQSTNPCKHTDCVIQEVNIVSLVGPKRRPKFFYRKTRTSLTPIDAQGNLLEDGTISIDHVHPGNPAPEVATLIGQAEAALGQRLEALLNATASGTGSSKHAFGCADECDCLRKHLKIRLPDGREVDDPGQTIDGGQPRGPNAVPGEGQAMAVIEKRVNIPGRGKFLLTYEIRLFGTVRRFSGTCTPRNKQQDNSDSSTEQSSSSFNPGGVRAASTAQPATFRNPWLIGLGIGCISLCCLIVMAFAAWYFLFRPSGDAISETHVPTFTPAAAEPTSPPPTEDSTTATPEEATPESVLLEPTAEDTATPAPTPTESSPLEIFIADTSAGIIHFDTSSQITNTNTILDSNLAPVENALISITLTIPGGATQIITSTTDLSGQAGGAFDIFTYGDYVLSIDGLKADGYTYTPSLDMSEEYAIIVGPQETIIHPFARLQDFYGQFNDAFSSQDTGFLFDSLHPSVLEQYGDEACQQYLESVIENPIQVQVQELTGFGSWTWERDGFAVDVEHTYSLVNQITASDGSTAVQPTHLALVPGGSIGWFTDCGDPQ